MSKRMPPKWVSKVAPDPGPVGGVDNLPNPIGVDMKLLGEREAASEATPGAVGNPDTYKGYSRDCNGDNPKIADSIDFASGKDQRNRVGVGMANNPDAPGKVGAP
jgi:hypothetical protein